MLSRRDYQKRLREMEQKNEHFSIRKLSVGAASVLIGLSFLGFNTHSAQAAEKTDTNTVTKNKAGSITDNTKTFTVGEATTQPVNPKVNITTADNGDVHMSTTGTPLVQEDAPAYNGGVADSDPTSYSLPEAPMPADTKKGESSVGDATEASSKPKVVISTDKDGNVQMSTIGTPLVQENAPEAPMPADTKKGESSVGDATEASSKPKVVITTDKDGNVQMSTTGTPLVQENKPAYNGGVADSNPTSYALPEASIPTSSASSEAPASSAENSANSSASSEAPASSAENSASSSASSEAPVSSAENSASSSVATTNTVNAAAHQVSTPVVSRADVHNGMSNTVNHGVVATNQNQSKALPQTGAKANMAGMLGLMVASVGAILGLAVTKKHEN